MDVIDWLKSEKIEVMSNACVGAYILLLCEAWTRPNCSLPSARLALRKLARWDGTDDAFTPVVNCFEPLKNDRTRLVNPRLKREWDDTTARIAALSEAGKRGAQMKQELRKKKSRPSKPAQPSTEFEQFWDAYPKKEAKKAAQKAWTNAKDKPDVHTMIAVVVRSQASESWIKENGKYIPQPARWLNEGRWSDQPRVNGHGKPMPPPFPPKTDPIARGQWRNAYGDPAQYGYE